MNATSLITLPIRLGLAAASRAIELVGAAGSAVGLGGTDSAVAEEPTPATPPRRAQARGGTTSRRSGQRKPAGRRAQRSTSRSGPGARKASGASRRSSSGTRRRTTAPKQAAPTASPEAGPPAGKTAPPSAEPAAAAPDPPRATEPQVPAPAPPPREAPASPQAAPGLRPEISRIDAETPTPEPARERRFTPAQPAPAASETTHTPSEPTHAPSEPAEAEAEPSPAELAERGEGRRPAPLGAREPRADADEPGTPG